jgi:hypothetical protein
VSPVKYELGFYIPEDDILHSHCRENLTSYIPVLLILLSVLRIVNKVGESDAPVIKSDRPTENVCAALQGGSALETPNL